MKRPLLCCIISFIIGIVLIENISGIAIIAVPFVLCEIICYLLKKSRKCRILLEISAHIKILLFLCAFLGMMFSYYFNLFRINEIKTFDKKTEDIVGVINNEGVNKEKYWEYILKDCLINGNRIRSNILIKTNKKMNYGNKVKIKATMEMPKIARNKNAFNYAKYLKTLNIYITAKAEEIEIINDNSLLLVEKVSFFIRNKVREFTDKTLDSANAGILNALIIGDDVKIDEGLIEDYKKAGMIHLLVVSGGHTVFLITLLKFIFRFLGISKNVSKNLYIFIIFLYIFITGGTPSILRAGIGIIIVIIAGIIGRENDAFTTLGLVAFILLINNPNTLFSLSFLLSFGGVIGIMFCYPKIIKNMGMIPKLIAEPLALTISAQLVVTPITIYSFNVIYLGGIISNILTLNLSGIIMMGGIILFILYLIMPPLVFLPMKILSIFISLMNEFAKLFSNIKWLEQYVITPNIISIILYYGVLIYFFHEKNIKNENGLAIIKYPNIPIIIRKNLKIIIASLGIISVFILNTMVIDLDKSLKISMIDVGHGDSILITTPNNKHILIDTGDQYSIGGSESDTGKQIIIPYLLKQGIKTIDFLILTHMDSDHIGGYESITKVIDVKNLGLSINSMKKEEYKHIKEITKKECINIKFLKRGNKFEIDGVKFHVLMPQKKEEVLNENNDSVVLLMEYQNKKVLFMGDLENEGEKELMNLESNLDIDVLKVGHHGSITSSAYEFITETTPEIALISVGNRFKSIPSKEVIKRLSSVHTKVYRTDENGEINIIINKGKMFAKTTY